MSEKTNFIAEKPDKHQMGRLSRLTPRVISHADKMYP